MRLVLNDLFEVRSNLTEVAQRLIELMHVDIPRTALIKEITEHPEYPGILSVSDALNKFGVMNVVAGFHPGKLQVIPTPFIAQLRGGERNNSYFTVVKGITQDAVEFLDHETSRWRTTSAGQFVNKYQGIVLLAEAGETTQTQKKASRLQYSLSICLPLLAILIGFVNWQQSNTASTLPFLFFLLSFAGCFICGLLLLQEVDRSHPLLKRFCPAGPNSGCNKVLRSKGAGMAGLKWSDIGAAYFAGTSLYMLTGGFSTAPVMFTLSWLAIGTIPFIAFSIIYQAWVIGSWCRLCLAAIGVLLMQLLLVGIAQWHSEMSFNELKLTDVLRMLVVLSVPFLFIRLHIPLLKSFLEIKQKNTALKRFRHNPELFHAALPQQKKITEEPDDFGIRFGKEEARHVVIKVCSPYCEPCALSHLSIKQLLDQSDVQIKYLFAVSSAPGDPRAEVVKHFLAIAESGTEETLEKALQDWYTAPVKDYKSFAARYPVNGLIERQSGKIAIMETWCRNNNISFTPTFFINGHQLPEQYSVEDLRYFLF